MRRSRTILTFLSTTFALATSPGLWANETSLRISEECQEGDALVSLREHLQLDAGAKLRIAESETPFAIDSAGRLLVANPDALDFETTTEHHLTIVVDSPKPADPLRNRFATLAANSETAEVSLEHRPRC